MILLRNKDYFGIWFIGVLTGIIYSIMCITILLNLIVAVIFSFLVFVFFVCLFLFLFIFLSHRDRKIVLKCPFCKKVANFKEEKLLEMFEE